jgi:murein DD-endopeptidase MepM/ murein hydrolase activator NlpD
MKKYYLSLLLLAIAFIFMQGTFIQRYETPELIPIHIPDPVLPLPAIQDTLKADTLYEGGDLSYMHFKPFHGYPDSAQLVLVLDTGEFTFPVGGKLTSGYGYRRQGWHGALDIGYNNRDTAMSMFDGVIRWSKYGYNGGYGNLVIIRHFNGIETYYAHFRELLAEDGDTVQSGDPIGIIGSTGNSLGPHLHFEMRFMGAQFNPNDVIDLDGDTLYSDTIKLVLNRNRYSVDETW